MTKAISHYYLTTIFRVVHGHVFDGCANGIADQGFQGKHLAFILSNKRERKQNEQ